MSRRRVSVKDLGAVDCEGWLQRRKEGRSFLGSKWKRYWFVVKKSSLYWYRDKMDVKAEGFINLSGFTIEQAKHCRKKHSITASHPQVVTIFIAAETFTEMNKWISYLTKAAALSGEVDAEECYSEGSDQDTDEVASTCSQDWEHETPETENEHLVQPPEESPSCTSSPTSAVSTGPRRRSTSEGGSPSRNIRRAGCDGTERLSWPHLPRPDDNGGAAPLPLIQVEEVEEEKEEAADKTPDEMEDLYKDLKAASLSVTGQPSRRDFRVSFIRRCRNDQVNDKLHLLRILSSTLKAKESELQTMEQILVEPTLTAAAYREWKLSNPLLLQEVRKRSLVAGGATELAAPEEPSG